MNYSRSERYALYGRLSRGFHMRHRDTYRNRPTTCVEEILHGELGNTVITPNVGAFITALYSLLTNIPFDDQELNAQGEIVTTTLCANSLTPGVEAEINSQFGNFSGNITATLQQSESRDYTSQQDVDGDGSLETVDFSGHRMRRQPRYLLSVTPRYDRGFADVSTSLQVADERLTRDAHSGIVLPSYDVWDASICTTQGPAILKLTGRNLTNPIGLTEGTPQTGQ